MNTSSKSSNGSTGRLIDPGTARGGAKQMTENLTWSYRIIGDTGKIKYQSILCWYAYIFAFCCTCLGTKYDLPLFVSRSF